LNAEENADAVFVIQINGALSTGTYAKVILINGAQAKNVYWKIEGAVIISDYSEFNGTIVANNGSVDMKSGAVLNGRALTTVGRLSTAAVSVKMPAGCINLGTHSFNDVQKVNIYPNPFHSFINIEINDNFEINNTQIILYDTFGKAVKKVAVSGKTTTLETSSFASGLYLYEIISNNQIVQTGKLLAK
jgi:hypothetical protein